MKYPHDGSKSVIKVETRLTCPACSGKGTLLDDSGPRFDGIRSVTCPECGGDGKVHKAKGILWQMHRPL